MNETNNWKIAKWPFILADVLLLCFVYLVVWKSRHPMNEWETAACFGAAVLGSVIGIVPFLLDYRSITKMIDVSALGTVADKIQNLETLAARIDTATNQWVNVQTEAEKISNGAKEISNRMAEEIRNFSDFMQKINDREKATLRLEVEKLRRGEGEWLQVLVHVLDHIFALHAAALRSGQANVAEQTAALQNACVNAVRRVGLAPFIAEPNEPFDPARHKAVDINGEPEAGAVVAETVGAGYTYQGRVVRPALVRLPEPHAETTHDTIAHEEPAAADTVPIDPESAPVATSPAEPGNESIPGAPGAESESIPFDPAAAEDVPDELPLGDGQTGKPS